MTVSVKGLRDREVKCSSGCMHLAGGGMKGQADFALRIVLWGPEVGPAVGAHNVTLVVAAIDANRRNHYGDDGGHVSFRGDYLLSLKVDSRS